MSAAHDHGNQPHSHATEQPGLEVVSHEQEKFARTEDPTWSGLQVSNHSYYESGKEAVSDHNDTDKIHIISGQGEVGELESEQPKRRKRLWLIIGGIIFFLVVAAAVIGGILGSKATKAAQVSDSLPTSVASPTSTPTPTDASNTTTKSQSIRQGSPLTVTGWSQSGGVELFLFYQDDDYQVHRSTYDTTKTSGNSSWQTPDKFNSSADASARLGATIIQYDASYQVGRSLKPQTEVFYTNDDGRVLGVSINDALSPNYEEDSIKNMVLNSRVNSSVAAYWPWVIYQESSGGIVEVRNRLRAEFSPAAEWDKKRLNISADSDSRLALVPLSANFSKIAVQGGYGIFYQVNGALVALIPDLGSDELTTDYADSWPTDFPAVTNMPGGAPFAAFSVARSSDTLQRVFTYVLYLDNDANINVIYNDASSWKTAQPTKLKGVDADTDITCLTMATTHRDSFTQEVVLGAQSFDPRCYFQREGLVREVVLTNDEWVDNGNVPIP
ncbi:hypothetical protein CSIM01_05769 [Colletotrichum simmondsii]|uniref:Fucose-specific lectin n=1 Tax=Colletotrichum simmondsii TaxID=703756 RepID=A0A135S9C5_9PEZI|nr:hypothetical protein CSIM01_05769 [Colletotrichum simmondsii]